MCIREEAREGETKKRALREGVEGAGKGRMGEGEEGGEGGRVLGPG